MLELVLLESHEVFDVLLMAEIACAAFPAQAPMKSEGVFYEAAKTVVCVSKGLGGSEEEAGMIGGLFEFEGHFF